MKLHIEVKGMDRMKSAFTWGLALAVVFSLGRSHVIVSAQEFNPCALLTNDDIHGVAAETNVAAGIASTQPSLGYAACKYDWGSGTDRFKLDVVVTDASRLYKGMS